MIKVFIQNEAGSKLKNMHNEKTLEYQETRTVSRPYPYPYGFILNTTCEDHLNLDCFVITDHPLKTGEIVECEPLGIMEQIEDGQEDHNILARLLDEYPTITEEVQARFTEFVCHVFDHVGGKRISVGRFLDKQAAELHIQAHLDQP